MATTTDRTKPAGPRKRDPLPLRVYSLVVVCAFGALVGFDVLLVDSTRTVSFGVLALWIVLAGLADTFRVRLFDEFSFAMSLPVTLAAAMVLSPVEAAVVAFVGAFDTKDLSGQIPLERVLMNRAIAGTSIYVGSVVFHAFGFSPVDWPGLLIASSVAYAADLIVNIALVAFPVSRLEGVGVRAVLSRVLDPSPSQTAVIYACVGLLAPVIALVSGTVGVLGVVVLLLPLGLARTAYLQALRLHEAAERLHDKNRALRETTQRVAEERRDERRTLAGELHDEVLPPLYKVHLMGQVLRQDLAHGRLLQLDDDIPSLLEATDAAQAAIRDVVRDLRDSPLGVGGLLSTLRMFVDQLEAAGCTAAISLDLSEVRGTERSLLVVYQVAKESLSNAVRYSRASSIQVRLFSDDGRIRLVVTDDGVGFDSRGVDGLGHFGLQLMRERAEAAGGTLVVVSAIGQGTTVAATVPPEA